MLPKPAGCQACQLYGTGTGFVEDHIPSDSKVMFLDLMPRSEEVLGERAAFTQEETQKYLAVAGLDAEGAAKAHVLRCRPPGTKRGAVADLPAATLRQAAAVCARYTDVPDATTTVVARGTACLAGIGLKDVDAASWRGFHAPQPWRGRQVFITVAPEDIKKQPYLDLVTRMDMLRLRRALAGEWPLELPQMARWLSGEDVARWFDCALASAAPVVIDTEYNPQDGWVYMLGLYNQDAGVLQWHVDSGPGYDVVARYLRPVIHTLPVIFQNSFADMPRLAQTFGIQYDEYKHIEDTMLGHSVLWSELPHRLEFLESLYGEHSKMKHLARSDPWLYNAGDVLSTSATQNALEREFKNDPQSGRVYREITLPLIKPIARANERGIRVNREKCLEWRELLSAQRTYAQEVAEAYVGYPISLGGSGQIIDYLNNHERFKIKSLDADTLAALRADTGVDPAEELSVESVARCLREGAHPLLEARALYAGANQLLSHYVEPFLQAEGGRIYPQFHIHAQANARWSIVDPPLQQLTGDMKALLSPDPCWPWFSWDWDQAELRVFTALANDTVMQEAFDQGWDVHTLNMCHALGYDLPPDLASPFNREKCGDWMGRYGFENKDDIRRTFAKRFIFRLLYGGDPRFAGDIPGAKKLGFDGNRLVQASKSWLRAHPAVARYWNRLEHAAIKTGISRNFFGRPRRMMTDDINARRRVAFNHPMQSAVADIKNTILRQVSERFSETECHFVFEVHDYVCFAVREDCWDQVVPVLESIAGQTWDVNGVPMRLPYTPKIITSKEVMSETDPT